MADWLVADWGYFGTNNTTDMGALYLTFQR
jgi:hypothetical protein